MADSLATLWASKQPRTIPWFEKETMQINLQLLDRKVCEREVALHQRLFTHQRVHYLTSGELKDDPDCDLCGGANESAIHFLCNCSSLSRIRRENSKLNLLTPNEVMASHIRNIFVFVKQSGSFPSIRNQYQTNQ